MHAAYTKIFKRFTSKFTNIKHLFRIVIVILKDIDENDQALLSC